MALGINYEAAEGGSIQPIVKYDSRAGRVFRIDRVDGKDKPVDITNGFKAVFDMAHIETGFIHFANNSAPHFSVTLLGTTPAARPTPEHKPGIRVMVKLSGPCGGDVRELASTAKAFLRGFDALHDEFVAGLAANPGKLPVVVIKETIAIVTEGGGQKSTNYSPVFAIERWIDRPADLVYVPRAAPAAAAPAGAPTTGSTKVGAPAQAAPAAADDFG